MSQENNSERDRCTTARMRSQWSACWAEKREVLERDAFQDLFERITNNPSQEQHPAEPHAELNDQQQNVLQSGPEFGQTGPHNQTQPEFNNVPAVKLTKHLEVRLAPVGLLKGDLRGFRRQSSFSLSRHRRLWKRWQLMLSLLSRHRRLWKRWQLTLSLLSRHRRLWKRWQLTLSLLSRHRRLWKRWQLTLSLLSRHRRLWKRWQLPLQLRHRGLRRRWQWN
ncbi:uncharacterized protein [Paralichthys olivaceus]|uniref:uncharacterized protein isoform X1 n=1 Tax=Paralichthys olivaceus TaxID=8255 RepID=UPI0037523B04